MSTTYDVIVIGVGGIGAAAIRALARRGVRVLGLDRHGVPNLMGSSGGDSRVIRRCYFEHPDYVPLLERAYERWRDLETDTGRDVLRITGGLYAGRPEQAFIRDNLVAARRYDIPHEELAHNEIAARFPQFTLPEDHVAIWEPEAGYVRCGAAITACVEDASLHGAHVHGLEPARAWSATAHGVVVETEKDRYHADRLVVCGGPWAASLLDVPEIHLTVTRQTLAWVWPRTAGVFTSENFPVWAIDDPAGYVYYGFPLGADGPGLKVARHHIGPPTDPDVDERRYGQADEAEIRAILDAWLPDANGPLLNGRVCLYTNSTDGHFIIDRAPSSDRVVFAAGMSGHGFKFASVIGDALADLALDARTELPIGFLSLGRFQ